MTKKIEFDISMNPDLFNKWVDTLEGNGDHTYDQGRSGNLCMERSDGTCEYCCLGVLLDIAVTEGYINTEVSKNSYDAYMWDGMSDFPSHNLSRKLGIDTPYHNDIYETFATYVARKNDESAWSFKKIAKFLRNNVTLVSK